MSRIPLAFFAVTTALALQSLAWGQTQSATPELKIDAARVTARVSPTLYGLMTEEINHSYDGGIYAELIQNRIFKDDPKVPAHWSAVQCGGVNASIALDESQPVPGTALTTCLKLDALGGGGIANDGYWGIPVKPQTTYRASVYAKTDSAAGGALTVTIESKDGKTVFAKAEIPQVTDKWQQYQVTLTTPQDVKPSADNRLVISTRATGMFWFNLVSLFPPTYHNRLNGNRIDLMELLDEMKPKFLRFPGGNFLQGHSLADFFPWKKTLGPLDQRPGHAACWRYRPSDGMGLLEFLEWCEDLQMQPVLGVYAGFALDGKHVDAGPALQPFVDDALDEIEYVTGDASTKWGAQRVKDGHPAPFPLTYVEIGNEDGADKLHSYQRRFAQFYDAIRTKYPHLQIIDSCGVKYWDHVAAKPERPADVIDEHFYYRSALEMQANADHYDTHDRKGPKIFVGEWATREGSPTTSMNAALGDAAWMTGLERNSDLVIMSCYAPLLVNVNPGGMQWAPDLIGYDALTSYGSPSYYAQKMFSTHLGDSVISVTSRHIPTQPWQPPTPKPSKGQPSPTPPPLKQVPTLFSVATKNDKGTIYLKVVNTAGTPQPVKIHLTGVTSIAPEGTMITLSATKPDDTNTITNPTKIVPVTSKATGLGNTFTRTFAPYSVNVLLIEGQ